MNYWTIMVITILGGPMEGVEMGLLYPSEQACRAAVNQVTNTLPYDYRVDCEVSEMLSSTIRPQARPERESNE